MARAGRSGASGDVTVRLTPSQHRVLELIAEGRTTSEIAAKLHRSVRTVETHRYHLGKKLGARTQVELVLRAHELGLIESQDSLPIALGKSVTASRPALAPERVIGALTVLDTGFHAGSGRASLSTLLSQMTLAFDAQAAFVCRPRDQETASTYMVTSQREVGGEASWPLDHCPAPRLAPGEVGQFQVESLHESVRAGLSKIAPGGPHLVVTLLYEKENPIGTLGMVRDHQLDRAAMAEALFRACAARASAELAYQLQADENFCLQRMLELHERMPGHGILRWERSSGQIRLSATAAAMLGLPPGMGTLSEASLLRMATANGDLHRTDYVHARMRSGQDFAVELAPGRPGLDNQRLALHAFQCCAKKSVCGDYLGTLINPDAEAEGPASTRAMAHATVSLCADPAVVVNLRGAIIAANAPWRELVAEFGVGPQSNYIAVGRQMLEEGAFGALIREIEALGTRAHDGPRSIDAVPTKDGTARFRIEVIPGGASRTAILRHIRIDAGASGEHIQKDIADDEWPADSFRWVFDRSSDLMCLCRLDGVLLRANGTMRCVLGREQSELEGRPFIGLFAEDEVARVQDLVARLACGERLDRVSVRMKHSCGDERVIEWSCTPPLPGADTFIPIGRDVTARHEAVRSLLSG
ncbi:MAG: PAS domain-containing protein [Phycisphaerales bacterium]|nr:PAS domain-containing protein [Phycisphaerales bacterium]